MPAIKIKGMQCQHCVASVTRALEEIDGIKNVKVELDKGQVSYEGDIPAGRIREAINKTGFEVEQ